MSHAQYVAMIIAYIAAGYSIALAAVLALSGLRYDTLQELPSRVLRHLTRPFGRTGTRAAALTLSAISVLCMLVADQLSR